MAGERRIVCEGERGLAEVCCGLLWVYVVREELGLVTLLAIPLHAIRVIDVAARKVYFVEEIPIGRKTSNKIKLPCDEVISQ